MAKKADKIFDEWLVLQAQAGDQQALKMLIRRWNPRLIRHALRYTNDAEAAKDTQTSAAELKLAEEKPGQQSKPAAKNAAKGATCASTLPRLACLTSTTFADGRHLFLPVDLGSGVRR